MNVTGINGNATAYGYAGRTQKSNSTESSFQTGMAGAQKTITLHGIKGSVDNDGNEVIGAWGDAVAGTSATVLKSADFDKNNPQYLVKIWNENDELVEERLVNVNEVDPKSSDAFDMYAYACHLSDSGQYKGAMDEFMGISAHAKHSRPDYSMADMLGKTDWTSIIRDLMNMQYKAGNLKGYMQYKGFYDFLLEQ